MRPTIPERAELLDVQDQEMRHVARKLSTCCSTGTHTKLPIFASVKVDLSDVDRNVASMGRTAESQVRSAHCEFVCHTC